jgi:hypothetical protein
LAHDAHKHNTTIRYTFLEVLYNKHVSKKSVVENAFKKLKNILKIVGQNNLHTFFFFPNGVTCCLLYNMILDEKDVDVNALM